MADDVDARLRSLGEALDKANQILAEPAVAQALADPRRDVLAGSVLVRLLTLALRVQTALMRSAAPVAPEPEPMAHHEPEPERDRLN